MQAQPQVGETTPPDAAMNLPRPVLLTVIASAVLLAACGGGGVDSGDAGNEVSAPAASPLHALSDTKPAVPSDIDADGSNASANLMAGMGSMSGRSTALAAGGNGETARPTAAAAVTAYFTPAQIRAAYGLDKLDAAGLSTRGAHLGSGQTIAIVNAFHNPHIAADLAAFSDKFGLAPCTVQTIGVSDTLPLPRAAAGSGCTFSVVNAAANGTVTATVPAVEAAWKVESTLDVEWAHAIAPMARLILVQAQSASHADLMGAINLANKLGANVVSMSFGSAEYVGQGDTESAFTTPGVTYVAAAGDNGHAVSWPAVMPQVLAVGGSTLGVESGARSETAWLGSGGGISSYNAAPSWQSALTAMTVNGKIGTLSRRAVPDVAFNANPKTGQLIYMTPTTADDTGWLVAGGTSIGTPQWAGIVAITNALRAENGKPSLGLVAAPLYKALSVSSTYANTMLDVTQGSNGNCLGCGATTGYDLVTGLGTPNAMGVINLMAGF
jgi:subtilase family serine protease